MHCTRYILLDVKNITWYFYRNEVCIAEVIFNISDIERRGLNMMSLSKSLKVRKKRKMISWEKKK